MIFSHTLKFYAVHCINFFLEFLKAMRNPEIVCRIQWNSAGFCNIKSAAGQHRNCCHAKILISS